MYGYRLFRRAYALPLFALLLSAPTSAAIVYVNKNASGTVHDGTSWSTAFTTVQAGINSAAQNWAEVWVATSLPAAPAYVENIQLSVNDSGVAVYGGFAGTETQRGQRNWKTNVTILDGNLAGDTVSVPSCQSHAAVLDGFTIRNGRNGVNVWGSGNVSLYNDVIARNSSSGVAVAGATATLSNVTVERNGGNGIDASQANSSVVNVSNSTVSAQSGAGVVVGENGSVATLTNVTISANFADGIHVAFAGVANVANTIIAFNGGFAVFNNQANITVFTHNDLYQNLAGQYSGFTPPSNRGNISLDPKLSNVYHNPHLQPGSPCINTGDDSQVVGVTDVYGKPRIIGAHVDIGSDESDRTAWPSTPQIWHVSTSGADAADGLTWASAKKTVSAAASSAYGGDEIWVAKGKYVETVDLPAGVSLYGGFGGLEPNRNARGGLPNPTILDGGGAIAEVIQIARDSTIDGFTIQHGCDGVSTGLYATLNNCTVSDNSEDGVFARGSLSITGCTICRNARNGISGPGAASVIANTIVTLNGADGIVAVGPLSRFSHNDVFGNKQADYAGFSPPVGGGNISADPQLSSFYADVHIQPTSPCLDAGDDSLAVWPADAYGKSRVIGAHVDIGSDESDGTLWPVPVHIWHVSTSGNDTSDGLTWATAKKTVIAAVSAAHGVDQIWVAEGTYAGIEIGPDIAVYGGFSGSETSRNQRNPRTHETTLTAGAKGPVVYIDASANSNTVIDGFTITGGTGFGENTDFPCGSGPGYNWWFGAVHFGAGVYIEGGSPTISHNVITNNHVTPAQFYGDCIPPWFIDGRGGGIYSKGSPLVVDNVIAGNTAADCAAICGGGLFVNNTIVANSEDGSAAPADTPVIVNASGTLASNIIALNNGGSTTLTGTAVLSHNDVWGNTADANGLPTQIGTNGNISADPMFAAGSYSIQSPSPCVETGDDSVASASATDYAGNPRIAGAHVDIGAYEFVFGTVASAATMPIAVANAQVNHFITPAPVVDLVDSSGRRVWSFNGAVSVSIEPGTGGAGATLAGTTTVSAVNGRAQFPELSVTQPGAGFVLRASSAGLASGDSSAFYVSGVPAKLVYQVQPAYARVGTPFGQSPIVLVQDSAGQVVPDFVGSVWIFIKPGTGTGGATLGGTTTVSCVGGVAKFSGLSIDKLGSGYVVTVATSRLPGVYSAPFDVLPLVYRVSPTGNDSADGASWDRSLQHISAAIALAGNTGEVWVQAGKYPMLTLSAGIGLYGGFAGTETSRAERNPALNVTTLYSSAAKGSVVTVPAGANRDTIIDGFTITGGSGTGIGQFPWIVGGGIYCKDASPTISNNVIAGNSVVGSFSTDVHPVRVSGGGGGGIYLENSNALVLGNSVTSNLCWDDGGGVYVVGGAPEIRGNQIGNNTSKLVTVYYLSGIPTYWGQGGGIECVSSSALVIGNLIANNNSPNEGGGILSTGGSVRIVNNVVNGNVVEGGTSYYGNPGGYGGGLYTDTAILTANLIYGNTARTSGGGVSVTGISTITNNTIVGNSAADGGGLDISGTANVANTILTFNDKGVYVHGGSAAFSHCDVYGNSGYDYGGIASQSGMNGNISQDPVFVDRPTSNYRLQAASPCIDAGDDAYVLSGEADLDGNPRILGARVDIGAYEFRLAGAYVNCNAAGPVHDGRSWATAFLAIQDGINAVAPRAEVWVAKGTYTGNGIRVTPNVSLLGGFAGTETSSTQRDYAKNITLLDGNADANGYAVAPILSILGSGVTIDGFTFRNGSEFTGPGSNGTPGAAIRYDNHAGASDAFTISHNDIGGCFGSAIYCGVGSVPTISNNNIHDNIRGSEGGGIRLNGSVATIRDNLITGNTVTSAAGGVRIYASTAKVTNNTILNCAGASGIGIAAFGQWVVCANNIVGYNGGGAGLDNRSGASWVVWRNSDVFANADWNYDVMIDQTGSNFNISKDPQFLAPTSGDYHLFEGSYCIDTGDDAYVRPGDTDLDGKPRIQGGHVDMGCYEFPTPTTLAISDVAGVLRVSAGIWAGTPESMNRVNPDKNGVLDILDAVRLARKVAGLDP